MEQEIVNQNNGCHRCGNTEIHACTGMLGKPWTEEEKSHAKHAFEQIAEREQQAGKCEDGQDCINHWLCFMFRTTPAKCIRQDGKPRTEKFTFQKFGLIDK